MVAIPKGENFLGNRPYEKIFKEKWRKPYRKFKLDKSIAVSKYELTRNLYYLCILDGDCTDQRCLLEYKKENGKVVTYVKKLERELKYERVLKDKSPIKV